MRSARDYYEILGLPRDASRVRIKRRYRELVRKYHPDVAADKKTAHRLFIQINEAYQALNDPVRRRAYDATLKARDTRTSQTASRATTQTRAQATAASSRSEPFSESVSEHLKKAQWEFIQRRFHQSALHCKDALRINPRSARAYTIMGDIYRAQRRVNEAVNAYSSALQFDPHDRATEKKLMDMVGQKVASTGPVGPSVADPKRRLLLNVVLTTAAFFLLSLIAVYPGLPISWLSTSIPPISMWSWNLVVLIAAASVVVGVFLSVNGLVAHPDDELVFENTGQNWAVVPAGIILLIGSAFFFPAAASIYIVIGIIQGTLTRSMLTVFAGVLIVVGTASAVYLPDAFIQVLLFGGNVSFLSMLVGWYTGATAEPLGEY